MAVALLLVEDNEDILANLYAFLEPLGYELDCARNGRTGLAMALEQHFDCIVLDIMLPGIDGICLCRELRDKHHKHTPIIMLTARDAVASNQNSAAVRWSDEPAPDDANVILPGVFLSSAISSATEFAGKFGLATSTFGARTATVIGSRSFTGSHCSFFWMNGLIA